MSQVVKGSVQRASIIKAVIVSPVGRYYRPNNWWLSILPSWEL